MKTKEHEDSYKRFICNMLASAKSDFCPLRKERQMDYLFSALKNSFEEKGQMILDAGCGYGRLLHFLYEFDSMQNYHGIDYVQELVEQACIRFSSHEKITFECSDLYDISKKYSKYFDIAISYKTLSWVNYYENMVKELFAVTKKKIYLTSLFYDGDIDFITKIYPSIGGDYSLFSHLNTYSYPKFEKFCKSIGAKEVKSFDMKLDVELLRTEDLNKLQTFTMELKDRSFLEVTGIMILNWKLIEIVL